MAASDGTHGHGTTLSGSVSSAIGNITNLSIGSSRDPIDISTMGSDNKYREFIPGMADGGEITLTVNYDGAAAGTANVLDTAINATAAETWTVTFPDTSTWAASGFITSLGIAVPYDDKITQDVTIKISGKPTYTDKA